MKWLLDEMLPAGACRLLVELGHDAVSVHDVLLGGAADDRVYELAVREGRVVVTENFADFALLLEQGLARGEPCVPVVFVHKTSLPRRGALAPWLAARLDAWARTHTDPYVGAHWL